MNVRQNKVSDVLYTIFYVFCSLTIAWIVLLNARVNLEQFPWVFPLVIFMLGLLLFFLRKISFFTEQKLKRSQERLFISLVFIISFVITIFIAFQTKVDFTWDFGTVQRNAYNIAVKGEYLGLDYFARYPNNNLMLLFTVGIYKPLAFFFPHASIYSMYKVIIILNSLLINLSILLTYFSAKKIWNFKIAVLSMVFMYMCTPILLYSEIFYTDTVGLFFISLILYLHIKKRMGTNKLTAISILVLNGFIIGIGYRLKAFAVIIAVAIIIELLLDHFSWKEKLQQIIVFIGGLGLALLLTSAIFNQTIPVNERLKEENEFPLIHWIMMGINQQSNGGFSQDDYNFSYSINGFEQKKEKEMTVIKERVEELGPVGLVKLLFVNKLSRTWADGAMKVDYYGSRESLETGVFQEIYDRNGKYNEGFRIYYQVGIFLIWLFILIGVVLWNKRSHSIDFINISLIGMILFQLLWECNARYIYCFIPLLILSATNGLVISHRLLNNGRVSKERRKTRTRNHYKDN